MERSIAVDISHKKHGRRNEDPLNLVVLSLGDGHVIRQQA